MTVYKHNCQECQHLGTDTLYDIPVDIYYCEAEQPTMVVRTGDFPHQYSSVDIPWLLANTHNPGTKTLELMVKYLKKLSLEQSRIIH